MTQILDELVKITEPLKVNVLEFAKFAICATNHTGPYERHFWRIVFYRGASDRENFENLAQLGC